MEKRNIAFLATVHFFNDSYASFLPPLLPLLMQRRDLSITSATFLVSLFTFSSSITQPVFGYLADRVTRRYFVVMAPILSALFMSSIGVATSYSMLASTLLIGGLGIAAFHPQTVSLAGLASGGRKGLGVSLFISGGTIGYALGPLWIVSLVMVMGLESSLLAAIPGLVFVAFLLGGGVLREKVEKRRETLSLAKSFGPHARAIGLLFIVVVLWTVVRTGFISLLPILYAQRGHTLLSGGGIITIFVISGALGGIIGGHLSDRVGRKAVIRITLVLCVPFLYGFVKASGPLSLVLLAVAGMFLNANASVVVAMAQELIPENVGTASSIVMGLAWGIGGLLVVFFGMAAEQWGTAAALTTLSIIPLVASFCAFFLPEACGAELQALAVRGQQEPQ